MENTKSTDVHIRISIKDKRKLQEKANKQNLTLSDYILKNTLKVEENEINLELLSAYTKITDSINEISALAEKNPDGELEKAILSIIKGGCGSVNAEKSSYVKLYLIFLARYLNFLPSKTLRNQ